ncbi:hypothetical protein SAMN06269117_12214 [Balnearium lithotrophicum]|jgi:F0F1-type ATP synthase membrane subunit b/b'|uniref:Uncharacterized protein n=2 Tax=Balnearium lithotrophicum TaxID=223788 RepID=A0A521DKM2_9BACT|nr:hypothetical protein SAMN06269117_12214 [Balnearium lithotrophicum]
MVQLLLIINFILIVLLFFLLIGEFMFIKNLKERIDEIESNLIKVDSKASNSEFEMDKIREQLSFLKNQVKTILSYIRR